MSKARSPSRKKELTNKEKMVCERLREIWDRKSGPLGLTQERAAEIMNITQGAVGHFLGRRNRVHVEAVFWFADMLNVHPLEIDPDLFARIPGNLRDALKAMPGMPKAQLIQYAQGRASSLSLHE